MPYPFCVIFELFIRSLTEKDETVQMVSEVFIRGLTENDENCLLLWQWQTAVSCCMKLGKVKVYLEGHT
jgi:hypothetical protein